MPPKIRTLPGVSDVYIPQDIDYPSLRLDIDRERAAELGLDQREVVNNVITALTSNQMIAPSYWVDPKSGNDYMLTVQYPEDADPQPARPAQHPAARRAREGPDAARRGDDRSRRIKSPTEIDHYQIPPRHRHLRQPAGEDLGALAHAASTGSSPARSCPRASGSTLRGMVQGMQASFKSFGLGLILALVLLYLILVAQFRSFIDPLLILLAVPPGLDRRAAGAAIVTGTTLNVQSLMGVLMMVGMVVSNSILIVEFTHRLRRRRHAAARRRGQLVPHPAAADPDDVAGHRVRPDPDGAEARHRQRSLRAAGARDHRRPARLGRADGVHRSRRLSLGSRQRRDSPQRGIRSLRGNSMILKLVFWCGIVLGTASCWAQSTLILGNPSDAPVGALGNSGDEQTSGHDDTSTEAQASTSQQFKPNNTFNLSVKDAEAIALKNNPAISVARLSALASQQVTREVRSGLWPTAYANLTAVDAHDDSRISAGGLNNPIIFARAAAGATVSQLITDFGHTTNLVASARLQAKAEDQNALATKEDVLLAVDQAFYNALQAQAVLKVAQQTVDSRQLLSDQVSALTKSKLKSDLDLSFANVNLAQAKLLQLDAQNNEQAAFASLSAVLGFPTMQNVALIEDIEPLVAPSGNPDELIAEAFSKRPEILALEFESESAHKLRTSERDQNFPTISALGAIGATPFGDSRLSGWYGAVGVNVQIPIFNGFLFSAKTHESDLREQAAKERILDLRNRISREVRTSWLDASTSYQRLSVSRQLLDQANQALDLSQTRYKLGLGSIVELSQAQLQQTQAEIGSTQAGYQYRLALSVLRYQTSGL